ncbi:MAG: heme lyase CcmF/NrfE family subunit [Gammaproteobacteria bacterium]|nr:heme lyase CcmF/NrfE family subunit [Gammaproteobacteria bacterium]
MLPELGHFAVALALAVAILQTVLPSLGLAFKRPALLALAGPAARWQFALLVLAFLTLGYGFLVHDFSLIYVANNSNTALPWFYRLSAIWGAHEGSLLLWIVILAGWGYAVSRRVHELPADIGAIVLAVIGFVGVTFLLFMLFTSNPFARAWPAPIDGGDLNPLLQDVGLIVHPPLLYMGYVGFVVPFGFAVAALIKGRLTAAWARWARPWTLAAWTFLTVGIALGSFWAYYELGWGGWWFWDPVENASFMPWLLGTALIHSLAASEKRGVFKNWTVLLAITTFALSLLGTFLVRSGVLTSVHAFATDPARGVFVLGILGTIVGGSLGLYAWRGPRTLAGGSYSTISRETFLLANSLLLCVATMTVLLGTLYPLVLDALGMGKISVGPPYFNRVFVWVMAPLIVLLGLGQSARWKEDSLHRLLIRAALFGGGALVLAAACAVSLAPDSRWRAGAGLLAAFWILGSVLAGIVQRLPSRSIWQTLRGLPLGFYGQALAHAGFAVTLIGVTLTSTQTIDLHTRAALGATLSLGPYEVTFDSIRDLEGSNYRATEGQFTITRDGELVRIVHPQKRFYQVRGVAMTEAGIVPGITRDLYISLGEPLGDGAWSVRMHIKAFVRWLWFGALMMALGGFLAVRDRRVGQPQLAGLEQTNALGRTS